MLGLYVAPAALKQKSAPSWLIVAHFHPCLQIAGFRQHLRQMFESQNFAFYKETQSRESVRKERESNFGFRSLAKPLNILIVYIGRLVWGALHMSKLTHLGACAGACAAAAPLAAAASPPAAGSVIPLIALWHFFALSASFSLSSSW